MKQTNQQQNKNKTRTKQTQNVKNKYKKSNREIATKITKYLYPQIAEPEKDIVPLKGPHGSGG